MSVVGLLRRPATGAVAGQVTQALAGLLLQVVAARSLGAGGFAFFALAYGAIVLATAVSSGLVGDSLTVLDRHEPAVRAGLHAWTVTVAGGAGLVGAVLAVLTGIDGVVAALVLGLATALFIVEDTLRRMLMATGRFWSLPAVDGTSLVLSLSTLLVAALAGELTLTSFMLALVVGQGGASVVAYWRLAPEERPRGPWRAPAWGTVFAYGSWRAAAQTVRPALLTALRLLVVLAAGAAAYGPIEAARLYTAPTLVVIGGLGSFLLPRFVALRGESPAGSLRLADRAAGGLAGAVVLIGAVALLALPLLGPLVTGGAYDMSATAVAGWSVYAVASAFLLPYGVMAAAHHRQAQVLGLRSLELLSLTAVLVLVLAVPSGAVWTPMALAIGPVLAAVAVRQWVLRPLVTGPRPAEAVPAH